MYDSHVTPPENLLNHSPTCRGGLQMALLVSSVLCNNTSITTTMGQEVSQEKQRKWQPDMTIYDIREVSSIYR